MRRTFLLHHRMPTLYLSLLVQTLATLLLWFSCLPIVGQVHAEAPITPSTPSGLHTQISDPVITGNGPTQTTQYNISGGTRPGGVNGTNLFHSFGDFNVPTNNIANFLNGVSFDVNGTPLQAGLPTSNILGTVTGVNPSIIFGAIQTNGTGGFGKANLFLMNPHGFLFGPNASVNVGGMVAFTTADYLQFQGTDTLFNKVSTPESLSLLSTVPVEAFGFLGSNPAAIAIQGSTLQVARGQSLSFVGGNTGFKYIDPDTGIRSSTSVPGGVTMTGGKLLALDGQINIASVASHGEVSAVDFMPAPGMTMGDINLSQGALLDVSADAAGTVRIRGGQFVIDSATISADTKNAAGAQDAIHINVTGDMSLANELSPALTARTTGSGNAGAINIQSGNLDAITSSSDSLVALVDTHTSGTGTAGSVTITTGDLHTFEHHSFFIDTGTAGTGHGGAVGILGTNIFIEGESIATGNLRFGQGLGQDVSGSAGNLSITATETLQVAGSTINTDAWFAEAGNITLAARDVNIIGNSSVSVDGDFGGAPITVTADRLRLDFASVLKNNTVVDPGGDITINARIVELKEGSVIQTSTPDDGRAGNINITATERVTLDDQGNRISSPAGLLSNSTGDFGSFGNSGSITVKTPQLEIFGGAQINTSTRSSGNAGVISISSTSATISGERLFETPDSIFQIGSTRASGIYTRTVGSQFCSGRCGNAGNVTVTTGSLNLESGGTINSGTINSGAGGSITINAANTVTMSGTMQDGTPSGVFSRTIGVALDSGNGGNIALTAGQSVAISDGASVSASSTGPGNAGNILIDAGQQLDLMGNSSVTTEAKQASGGDIDIRAINRVRLVDSSINTSVFGGDGNGGNITIDPNVVVLQGSQVKAEAFQGVGGDITITTPLFLADSTSTVSALSPFGLNGRVTIQSPTSNLSGSLGPLTSNPSQAQALLTQRCAALANGQTSSFVVAGREQLPSDPGGWLNSPLAFTLLGESLAVDHAVVSAPAIIPIAALNTGTVSLRRLTPAGFLMANFADSEATGCRS